MTEPGAMTTFTNVYGRVLPIDQQEAAPDSGCVTCGHPHWDRIGHHYVRCGMCTCENVGSNTVRSEPEVEP